jgi:hypothetical protein
MGYLTRVALGPRRFYGEVPTSLSALDLRATNLHPSRRFQKSLMTPPLRTLYQGGPTALQDRVLAKRGRQSGKATGRCSEKYVFK